MPAKSSVFIQNIHAKAMQAGYILADKYISAREYYTRGQK